MKITKRTKKNIGSMTFKQLMEAFTSDDETSNIEDFDEFADADIDDGADEDGADEEGADEVTVSLTLDEVEVLRGILAKIDGDTDEEPADEEPTDEEPADEEGDDEDFGGEEETEGEEPTDEEEYENEYADEAEEDEEAVVTNGAPTKKVGTPSYSNKSTVDSVYTRGAKSGIGSAATVSGQGPTKKVGTPATNANASTVSSKIAPGKHVFEI